MSLSDDNLPPLPDDDAAAFMYPSDLAEFERKETTAEAVSVSCTDIDSYERTVPLFTADQMHAYAKAALAAAAQGQEPVAPASEQDALLRQALEALEAVNAVVKATAKVPKGFTQTETAIAAIRKHLGGGWG